MTRHDRSLGDAAVDPARAERVGRRLAERIWRLRSIARLCAATSVGHSLSTEGRRSRSLSPCGTADRRSWRRCRDASVGLSPATDRSGASGRRSRSSGASRRRVLGARPVPGRWRRRGPGDRWRQRPRSAPTCESCTSSTCRRRSRSTRATTSAGRRWRTSPSRTPAASAYPAEPSRSAALGEAVAQLHEAARERGGRPQRQLPTRDAPANSGEPAPRMTGITVTIISSISPASSRVRISAPPSA